jgi:hypothetical protein
MTTGNDPALPADNSQPAAPAAATAAPGTEGAGGVTFTHPQPVDVDDAELNDAKTAAQAEKTAGEGNGQADPSNGKDPAQATKEPPTPDQTQQGQQPPQQQQPAEPPPMIPKARFDEVNSAKSRAEQDAAYWKGVAEARAQMHQPQGGATAQPPQPTPQQRLEQIHTAQDELAAKFDNGEITMAEFKKQERDLNSQEAQLREEALAARLKPAAAAPASSNDELYLETLTANLEKDHPWVLPFNAVATEAEWQFLSQRARENLNARGVEIKGTIGSYELRKEISVLIDKLAPNLIADRLDQVKQKGFTIPGTQSHAGAQQQPPASSGAAAARAKALEKAAAAPPDLSSIPGSTGDTAGQVSEQRLEAMSEDEIGALPVSVKNKLLGITA